MSLAPPQPLPLPAAPAPAQPGTAAAAAPPDPLRVAARAFEAAFLAEMFAAAGLGQARGAFGGGVGEDQLAGLLARARADAASRAGGFGLAESIYRALRADTVGDQADAARPR